MNRICTKEKSSIKKKEEKVEVQVINPREKPVLVQNINKENVNFYNVLHY